jgi:hypothetical protein
MADAMETARNEGIPALPPLQPVAPVVHMPDEGDGQNRLSASDVSVIGASTTPTPPPANSRAGRQLGFVNDERCNVIFRGCSEKG